MAIQYEDTLKVSSAGAMEMEYPIAGLGSRSYAFTVDWHIRVVLVLAWLFAVYMVFFALNQFEGNIFKAGSSNNQLISSLMIYPALAIYGLYHPVLEIVMKGRTPGKRIAGIRIVTLDGNIPGATAIIVRNLFRLIDSLPSFYMVGIASCFLTNKQIRVGDLAAHTLLIHEEVMEDKAIELMSNASHSSGLSAPQIEVLHDLLKRWKELERETRIRLGSKLLEAAGKPVAADDSISRQDNTVFAALNDLIKQKDEN